MRRVRYLVAMSLDGYIAGPHGEFDWIRTDPEFDFGKLFRQFDTLVAGRRTFEPMAAAGRTSMPGMKTIVVSKTLRPDDHPEVTIVPGIDPLKDLKAAPGKDIWLFGGGQLFRSLAGAGMVDTVEVSIQPVLLGSGIPLAPGLSTWTSLLLVNHTVHSSGAVSLEYTIRPG
ncbi:MAG TPA: dihydrofolate reductase family protein [Bryobacteraceae bacterium]|nr:dihydrofolate reductase family protein [Bryobacteraceae bacterium]